MNTGAHDAGGGFTSSVGANAARGVGVILAAVVVGLLLMQYGLADNSSAEAVSSTNTSEAADAGDADANGSGDEADTGAEASTETTAAAAEATTTTETTVAVPAVVERLPSEVKVLALNAAVNKKGIAGRTTERINAENYITLKAADAIKDQETQIQYMESYEASAAEIAAIFGLDASYVVPFDPENSPIEDTGGAHVLVVIGLDNAIDL